MTAIAATAIAGALLALWLDVRVPKLGPRELMPVVLNLVASTVVAQLVVPLALGIVRGRPMLALLGVALPALTYIFVSWLWFLKFAQRAIFGDRFGSDARGL